MRVLGSQILYLIHAVNNVTLSAKSSLILGENKAGFPRENIIKKGYTSRPTTIAHLVPVK